MQTGIVHKVRANIWAPERTWRIDPDALSWQDAKSQGAIRYADIARMNVRAMPNVGGDIRQCIIKTKDGKKQTIGATSYNGLASHDNRMATYEPLVRELARRVMRANPEAQIQVGTAGFWVFWLVCLILIAVMLAIFAVALVAVPEMRTKLIAPVLIFLLLLPGLWRAVRRGKGQDFNPETPPPGLLKDEA